MVFRSRSDGVAFADSYRGSDADPAALNLSRTRHAEEKAIEEEEEEEENIDEGEGAEDEEEEGVDTDNEGDEGKQRDESNDRPAQGHVGHVKTTHHQPEASIESNPF